MTDFKTGQRVRVSYEGTVVNGNPDSDGDIKVRRNGTEDFDYDYVHAAAVEALTPESWPPLAGDVWEWNGNRWFGKESRIGRDQFYMVPSDEGNGQYAHELLAEYPGIMLEYRPA